MREFTKQITTQSILHLSLKHFYLKGILIYPPDQKRNSRKTKFEKYKNPRLCTISMEIYTHGQVYKID